jgi:membrane protease YdiL (CAAX protease family)
MTTPYDPVPLDVPSPAEIPAARPMSAPPTDDATPIARSIGTRSMMSRGEAAFDIVLIIAMFVFLQIGLELAGIPERLAQRFPSLGVFWVNVCFGGILLIAIFCILILRNQSTAVIGLVRTPLSRVCVFAMIGLPACYAATLVTGLLFYWLVHKDVESLAKERSHLFEIVPHMALWQTILLSAFVGVHEEVLFRGFLLGRMRAFFRSNLAAVFVSSLIFGLPHVYQGTMGVVQTASIGVVLALITLRARSLWPAILAHAMFDAVNLAMIPLFEDVIKEFLKQAASAPSG